MNAAALPVIRPRRRHSPLRATPQRFGLPIAGPIFYGELFGPHTASLIIPRYQRLKALIEAFGGRFDAVYFDQG